MSTNNEGKRSNLILLIDDDASILNLTRRLLTDRGYRVHSANDGEQAIAEVRTRECPDLILTDFHMPGINGRAVIDNIRAWSGQEVPAVIMGGDALLHSVVAAEGAEVGFLRKPFQRKELYQRIDETLLNPSSPSK